MPKAPDGAMIVLTIALIVLLRRIRPAAAFLLVPYLAWLCFAAALNYQILADKVLRKVVLDTLAIPEQVAVQPVETQAEIIKRKLDEANATLTELSKGLIMGRAVLIP